MLQIQAPIIACNSSIVPYASILKLSLSTKTFPIKFSTAILLPHNSEPYIPLPGKRVMKLSMTYTKVPRPNEYANNSSLL